MSKKYTRPKYLENKTRYIIELPFVQTSGAPGSIYEWNNGAHAAIHSILAGLMCEKKKDVHGWLFQAQRQLNDAVTAIAKPRAKIMPAGQNGPSSATAKD